MRSFSRTCAAPAMRHPRSFGPVRAPRVRRPAAIVGLPATAIVLLRNLFIGAAPMTWLGIVVLTLGVGAWLMDRDHKRKLKDCEESWKHDMKIMTDGRDEFMKDLLKERDARKAADKALVDCRRDAESAIAEWQAHAKQWQQVAQANQAANKDFSQAYREVTGTAEGR